MKFHDFPVRLDCDDNIFDSRRDATGEDYVRGMPQVIEVLSIPWNPISSDRLQTEMSSWLGPFVGQPEVVSVKLNMLTSPCFLRCSNVLDHADGHDGIEGYRRLIIQVIAKRCGRVWNVALMAVIELC